MIKYIVHQLKTLRKRFYFFILINTVSSFFVLLLPVISGSFIDVILEKNFNRLNQTLLLFFIFSMINVISNFVLGVFSSNLKVNISLTILDDTLSDFHYIDLSSYKRFNSSYLAQRIYSDCFSLSTFLIMTIANIPYRIILTIIPIIFMFFIDKMFLLVVVVSMFVYIFLYGLLKGKVYSSQMNYKENENEYYAMVYRQFSLFKMLRINSLWDIMQQHIQSKSDILLKTLMKSSLINGLFSNLSAIISTVIQIALLIIGGYKISKGMLTIGEFVVLLSMFPYLVSSLSFFFNLSSEYQAVRVNYNRLKEINTLPKSKYGVKEIHCISSIDIVNVEFSFDEKKIFSKFNYNFEQNKTYIIWGANGKGKTTLLDLVFGLYKAYGGEIYFNKINLQELNIETILRNEFSVCEQNSDFEGISYLNLLKNSVESYEKEDLMRHLSQFNLNSQEMLEKIADPNAMFSGGEKKKLLLIKCFLKKNSSVYIFDEPTTNLDSKSIEIFKECISKYENKIIIIVTHDSNLLSLSDYILDFDNSDFK